MKYYFVVEMIKGIGFLHGFLFSLIFISVLAFYYPKYLPARLRGDTIEPDEDDTDTRIIPPHSPSLNTPNGLPVIVVGGGLSGECEFVLRHQCI